MEKRKFIQVDTSSNSMRTDPRSNDYFMEVADKNVITVLIEQFKKVEFKPVIIFSMPEYLKCLCTVKRLKREYRFRR